jgi:hypothetical protein
VDSGVVVPDSGGRDFDGVRLDQDAPNIGAFERAGRS